VTAELVAGRPVAVVAVRWPDIPPAERDKVFRRFYRLDASRATAGSGLGLSLVAAIAELHHVSVELTDNGPGLRAALRFPASG
jgi:signal transduction histidine kinase